MHSLISAGIIILPYQTSKAPSLSVGLYSPIHVLAVVALMMKPALQLHVYDPAVLLQYTSH